MSKMKRTNKKYWGIGIVVAILLVVIGLGNVIEPVDSKVQDSNQSALVEQEVATAEPTVEPTVEPTGEPVTESTGEPVIQETEQVETQTQQSSEAKIHFINTGNSDAILIVDGNRSVLIDGGDNDDETLVANYVKNQGISTLTYVFSTHPDADHCGGLDGVLNAVSAEHVFVANGDASTKTYKDFITSAINRGLQPSVPLDGAKYQVSETSYLEVYNTNGGSNNNEASLVILYVNGKDKILFMGDAGVDTETELLSKFQEVDLVKIGHHGSSGSTSQKFIDQVNPEYAVILTGANSYGHPTSTVLNRLQNKNVELHRSDECGDIIFTSTGNGVTTQCAGASFTPGNKSEAAGSTTTTQKATTAPKVTVAPTVSQGGTFIITQTGEKYHKSTCSTIKQVKSEVTREEAERMGYTACGRCKP